MRTRQDKMFSHNSNAVKARAHLKMEQNEPSQLKFIEKDEEDEQHKPGRWAYAVVVGAFFINFICKLFLNLLFNFCK